MSTAERTLTVKRSEGTLEREQPVRGIAMNNDEPPEWIALQQEIYNRLVQLKKLTELGVTGGLDDSLEDVNRKIEMYNELVPTTLLKKSKVTRDTFKNQLSVWE